MPLEIRLRPAARTDISAIWDHTVANWGEAQAGTYLTGLDATLTLIAEFPEMAREQSMISPPVRIHPYRSHVVIYRIGDGFLDVLAVKHSRSNWVSLLQQAPPL